MVNTRNKFHISAHPCIIVYIHRSTVSKLQVKCHTNTESILTIVPKSWQKSLKSSPSFVIPWSRLKPGLVENHGTKFGASP